MGCCCVPACPLGSGDPCGENPEQDTAGIAGFRLALLPVFEAGGSAKQALLLLQLAYLNSCL